MLYNGMLNRKILVEFVLMFTNKTYLLNESCTLIIPEKGNALNLGRPEKENPSLNLGWKATENIMLGFISFY